MKEVLRTQQLKIGYSGKALLPNIDVSMNEGDVVALAGPNGAGKTTLFKTLCGSIKSLEGEVWLSGKKLQSYSATERASLFSIVLTDKPDDLFLKVFDIVAAGRYPYIGLLGKLNAEDYVRIEESLSIVGITELQNRNFISLSDGEKQKVMIAKALAQDTPIIFMDEPAAFLDYPSKIELMSLMLKLSREKGKTILFSSHDLDLLIRHADKLWIISSEKPIATGIPEDLALDGTVDKYFSRGDIHFDIESGHFESGQKKGIKIGIKPEENTTSLWIAKALQRRGYEITPWGQSSTNVKAGENSSILLSCNGKDESFKTIEQLLYKIQNLYEK